MQQLTWNASQQVESHGRKFYSSGAPNLSELGNQIVLSWRGVSGVDDGQLWYTVNGFGEFDNSSWIIPRLAGDNDSSSYAADSNGSPCITQIGGSRLMMAWPARNSGEISYSVYTAFNVINGWAPVQKAIGPDGTVFKCKGAPAIERISDRTGIFMAWLTPEGEIHYSFLKFNTVVATWEAEQAAMADNKTPFTSNASPTIAYVNGKIVMVWRADSGNLYYSTYDVGAKVWSRQQQVKDTNGLAFHATVAPDIMRMGNQCLMVWANPEMYYSFYDLDAGRWSPQTKIAALKNPNFTRFSASTAPSVIGVGDRVFLAWTDRATLYYSTAK